MLPVGKRSDRICPNLPTIDHVRKTISFSDMRLTDGGVLAVVDESAWGAGGRRFKSSHPDHLPQ